jgi:hypothetical protein
MSTAKQYASESKLLAHQLRDLREKSGLSDETIASMRLVRLTVREVWQFVRWRTGSGGVLFPYLVNGQLIGGRVKLDKPYVGKNGKAAKYASPRGERIHLYIPPTLELARLRDATESLLIVEGEKEAAKAVQEGYKAIGIGGADSWRDRLGPLDEWQLITLAGVFGIIGYDSDVSDNPNVQRAERDLAAFLRSQGAIVRALQLPYYKGEKLGVGDALALFGKEWLLNLPVYDVPPLEAPKPKSIGKVDSASWAMAGLLWRAIEQEGKPELGRVVSSPLDKNKRHPGTKLVQVGDRILVAVEGKPFRGKYPWPIAVAWFNLGVDRREHVEGLRVLTPQDLKLVDSFLQYITPEGFHERDSDEATYFALWSTFLEIWQQRFPNGYYPVRLNFHLTILRALGLPWDAARIKAAWREIFDHGRVEEDWERLRDGKLHSVYRLSTDTTDCEFTEEETDDSSTFNNLTARCPCGCLQTLGFGRNGQPQKWASKACKTRFWRQTLHATNDSSTFNDLRASKPRNEDLPPWEKHPARAQ